MIEYVVMATNQMLRQLHGATPSELKTLAQERQQVERELANLVAFVAQGDLSSPRLRDEIQAREQRLAELDAQLDRLRAAVVPAPLQIDRAWVEAQVEKLNELLGKDGGRAAGDPEARRGPPDRAGP